MTDTSTIEFIANEMTFLPTPAQRRVKATFLARLADSPLLDPSDTPSLASVLKIVNDSRIGKWWPVHGFREWFLNSNEFREKIEYLAYASIDCLEELITNPETNANARVNAIKLLMELGRKMRKSEESEGTGKVSEKIASMTPSQLEEFISSRTIKLIPTDSNSNKETK